MKTECGVTKSFGAPPVFVLFRYFFFPLHVQVRELSLCQEFSDVRLRVNEKRVLNSLNRDKNKPSIR